MGEKYFPVPQGRHAMLPGVAASGGAQSVQSVALEVVEIVLAGHCLHTPSSQTKLPGGQVRASARGKRVVKQRATNTIFLGVSDLRVSIDFSVRSGCR